MKKTIRVLMSVILVVLATSSFYSCAYPSMKRSALVNKQEELARSLGVNITDYPYQTAFPEGYFYSVLKPGMALGEVHKIVRGYERVYKCWGTDEIYYYFSKNDDEALRFDLVYDDQGKFVELIGEDPDSRTLGVAPECSIGLLGR